MSDTFIHLHNHTEYSLLDGAQKITDLVRRAKVLGMPAVAMTDHGNIHGAVKFYKEAKKEGVNPIVGCELYVALGSRFDRNVVGGSGSKGKSYHHLVVVAENDAGFRNLIKLVTIGWLEGYYYRPRVDKESLRRHREGLIGLTGCLAGEVPTHLRRGDHDGARRALDSYLEIFGENNLYLEMQDQGIAEEVVVNEGIARLHRESGVPVVATNDCHFLEHGDYHAHEVLICIGTNKKIHDNDRMQAYTPDHYFKSAAEMAQKFGWLPQALANTVQIASRCELKLDMSQHHVPAFPVPEGETLESEFERQVRLGFERRRVAWDRLAAEGRLRHPFADYEARLERELATIRQMGFPGYFLVVWDFIRHARESGIPVGPGRGSAAGSLVAYCLWITDIDPLQYDLLFERFLNPERVSMPDIDIDFCFRRRGEVIDYVTQKYGRENVAQIITFGTLKAKAAVRDAARVLDMPFADADRLAKLVPDELGTKLGNAIKDVPKLKELYDTDPRTKQVLDVALRLEGLSRHASKHAAGVVITPRPVVEFAPLCRSGEDVVTQWAKDEVEAIGLLKMDFLGLITLTLITDTLGLIRDTGLEVPDLETIPLDDLAVFELFGRGDTSGVFQFESGGMRDILRRMKPDKFEDLIALNALYRPGPIQGGMIDDYIERRHGRVRVDYMHPMLEEVLRETYGVIVYQEQVMQVASKMGGYTLGGADLLRRAMGKKKAEEMAKHTAIFVKGATERSVSKDQATHIFELIEKFAGYGFNKSHSAAYALVAYQTAYLKAHFPRHFMAALMTAVKDKTDDLVHYISESRQKGVAILPPEIHASGEHFTVEGDAIRFGLAAVKGLGDGAVEQILAVRRRVGRFVGIDHFCREVDRKVLNRKVLEALIKSGAFDAFGERARLFAAIDGALERGARAAEARAAGQASLFGGGGGEEPALAADLALPEVPKWSDRERLAGEKESLGFYLSGHPLDAHADRLEDVTSHAIADIKNGVAEVTVGGLVTQLKRKRTKPKEPGGTGEWMAVFLLEDTTAQAEVVVFPKLYKDVGEKLEEDAAVVIRGRAEAADGSTRILAETLVPLDRAESRPVDGFTIRLDGDGVRAAVRAAVSAAMEGWQEDADTGTGSLEADWIGSLVGELDTVGPATSPIVPGVATVPVARRSPEEEAAAWTRRLDQLAQILVEHRGSTTLYFEVVRPGAFKASLQAGSNWNVKADRSLIRAVEAVLGEGTARRGRPSGA